MEQGDYKDTMKKYDSPEALHYLDPPYYGTKNDYGPGLDNVSPEEVKQTALAMKGNVIISYNDHPYIREVFCPPNSQFKCREMKQPVLATSKGALGARQDLLIIKE